MFEERFGVSVVRADFSPFVGTGENRYLGGVAEKYGVTLRMPQDKEAVYEIYLGLIEGQLQSLPGASDFVKRCRAAGFTQAVATSADRIKMEGNLRQIGLSPGLFDVLVTGSDVTRKKPAPDIFLAAIERLGREPSRCLVVEDSPSGVRAAKLAGAFCLGLLTSFKLEHLEDSGPDWIAPDLARLPNEVEEILFG